MVFFGLTLLTGERYLSAWLEGILYILLKFALITFNGQQIFSSCTGEGFRYLGMPSHQ